MTRFRPYRSGLLCGIRYHFDRAGDSIPEHTHDVRQAHNIIVLSGVVGVKFGVLRLRYWAGQIVDFDNAREHAVIAEAPRTETLHLYLNGAPEDYEKFKKSDLSGVIDAYVGRGRGI